MNAEFQTRKFGFEVSGKICFDAKLFAYVTVPPGFGTGSVRKNIEYGAADVGVGIMIDLFQNPDFMHDVPLKNCKS
jgi:hypothetical protein